MKSSSSTINFPSSTTTSPNPINYLSYSSLTQDTMMPEIFDAYNYNQLAPDSRENNNNQIFQTGSCNSPMRELFPDGILTLGGGGLGGSSNSDNGMMTLSPPYGSARSTDCVNVNTSDSEPDSPQDLHTGIRSLTGGLEAISQCDRLSEWRCFAEKNINQNTVKEHYPYPLTLITIVNLHRPNEKITIVDGKYLMMFLQHLFGFTVLAKDSLFDLGQSNANNSKLMNCTFAGKPDQMHAISCRPVGSYMQLLNVPDTFPCRRVYSRDSFLDSSLFIDLSKLDGSKGGRVADYGEDRIPVSHLFTNGDKKVLVLQDCWLQFHLNYEQCKTLFQFIGKRATNLHWAQWSEQLFNSSISSANLDANTTWYRWFTKNYPSEIADLGLGSSNEILMSLAKYIGHYKDYESMYIPFGLAVQQGWKLQLQSHSVVQHLKQIVALNDIELDTVLKYSLLARMDGDSNNNNFAHIGDQQRPLSAQAEKLLHWLIEFCQTIRKRHEDVLKAVQQISAFYMALPSTIFPVSDPDSTVEQKAMNQLRFEKMPFRKTMFSVYDVFFQCNWKQFTDVQLSADNRGTMHKEREIGMRMMTQLVDPDTSFSYSLHSISFYLRSLWNMWWLMFSTNLVHLQSEAVLRNLENSIDIDPKVSFLLNTNDPPIASMLIDKQLNRCNPNTTSSGGARDGSVLLQEQPLLFFNIELAGGWTGKWDKLNDNNDSNNKPEDSTTTRPSRSVIRLYMKIVFTGNSIGDFLLNINSRQQTHAAFQLADQLLELFAKFVVHSDLYTQPVAQLIETGQVKKQSEPFGYLSVKDDVSYTPKQEINVIVNPDSSRNLLVKEREKHAHLVLHEVLQINGMAGCTFREYCDRLLKVLHSPCGHLIPHYYRTGLATTSNCMIPAPSSTSTTTITTNTRADIVMTSSAQTNPVATKNNQHNNMFSNTDILVQQLQSTGPSQTNLRDPSVARRPVANVGSNPNDNTTVMNVTEMKKRAPRKTKKDK